MSLRKTYSAIWFLATAFMPALAMAEEGAASGGGNAMAAAVAISIAAFGGAIGQGMTAAAALQGIARNPTAQPKIFTPMIIGLALIESLVLYAFVIAFLVK